MAEGIIARLARRARRRALFAGALSMLLFGAPLAGALWHAGAAPWLWVCALAAVAAVAGCWTERRWRLITPRAVAEHLNRALPQLEDSAQLLLADHSAAPLLARLQRRRVLARLEPLLARPAAVALPRWPVLGLGGALLAGVLAGAGVAAIRPASGQRTPDAPAPTATLPGDLQRAVVEITPPAYTGLASRTIADLEILAEEGSDIRWVLDFSAPVSAVQLRLDDAAVVARAADDGSFTAAVKARQEAVYRVLWQDASGARHSDFHRLRLLRDQPPLLRVIAPESSPASLAGAEPGAELAIEAVDDYGLGSAAILVTVAKGQGEGVKFRDRQMPFDNRSAGARSALLRKTWRLSELGMQAGDELYVRALVEDRREPDPNRSQTPMLMIRWEGGEGPRVTAIAGVAVDLVPEYFRSQRQIIIDTEKLIEEAPQGGDRAALRSRSLAFEQKALRMRYGQYLGEEYESDIGGPGATPEGQADPDHEHETPADTTRPAWMDEFVHAHDSAEQATLFDAHTRAVLKDALAAMWRAELELHLARPQTALPHEYRALDLLKQVQHANRIYVRRAGFEPPPLDEGKRLSGDLDEAGDSSSERPPVSAPAADTVVARLLRLLDDDPDRPGPELAGALATIQDQLGGADLDARLAIARLLDPAAEEFCRDCLDKVRSAAWSRLPEPAQRAHRAGLLGDGRAGAAYLEALGQQP